MSVGGSLEEITLDGRSFAVTSDADVTRVLGGSENEQQPNGDGSARLIKTRKPWMLGNVVISIDDTRGDHEFLQDLADRKTNYPCSATYASGEVWQGTGQIVGEFQASSAATTSTVSLSGPGKLTRQVV